METPLHEISTKFKKNDLDLRSQLNLLQEQRAEEERSSVSHIREEDNETESGWKEIQIVKGPEGKSELVIENLENLTEHTRFQVKRQGDRFKIGIIEEETEQSTLRDKILHRARNRTIVNDSGGPVSIVSNDNRVSISFSNARVKSNSIA